MEFKALKEDLVKALGVVMGAIGSRPNLPVLNNILLESTTPDELTLTATDLEFGIKTTCRATVIDLNTATIPAKKLHDILRELSPGEVEVTVGKNYAVNIKTNRSFFKLVGLEPGDFPKFPEPTPEQSFKLNQRALKQALALTVFAISRDEARYALNGVLVAVKNAKVRFVATDGKRLACLERDTQLPKELDFEAIVPAKTVQELIKSLSDGDEEVEVVRAQNQIVFKIGKTQIASRLIEGKFPNFEQVIPKSEKTKTLVAREILLQAVRRVSLLTSQESQSVKLDFIKGRLLISSRSPNLGEAKEEIEVDVSGDDLSIGFNPGYLIDVLKNLDENEVSLSLTDPDKPGLIRSGQDYQYVIMPMQLT